MKIFRDSCQQRSFMFPESPGISVLKYRYILSLYYSADFSNHYSYKKKTVLIPPYRHLGNKMTLY